MNEADLAAHLIALLAHIAPEVRALELDPETALREQVDLDSMDFLNFITAVHHDLGVDVPELDYPQFETLGGAVRYVAARLPASSPPSG